jgi:O-antigen/teichoic acid export membrane protein
MLSSAKQRLVDLLRWSERYTKTDMIYLAKDGSWLGLGQLFSTAAAFVTAIAFANLISQDIYGQYKFVLSVAGILTIFSLQGLSSAMVRAVSQGARDVLVSGVLTHLKWSVGMAIAAAATALYYFLNENQVLGWSLVIVALLHPLLSAVKLYDSYLEGKKDFARQTYYKIAQAIIAAAIIVAVLFYTGNPIAIVLAYYGSATVLALIGFFLVKRRYAEHANLSLKPEILSFSKHLSLMDIFGKVAEHLDKVLIFHFVGAAPLAVYSIATAPIAQINGLGKILNTLALPKLSQRPLAEIKASIHRKALLILLTAGAIVAAYIIAAPFLFELLFPQYLDSIALSQWSALTLLALPLMIYQQTFMAHARKRELYIQKTSSPVIKIALLAVLTPLYGVAGVIAAVLIAKAALACMLLWMMRRAN